MLNQLSDRITVESLKIQPQRTRLPRDQRQEGEERVLTGELIFPVCRDEKHTKVVHVM